MKSRSSGSKILCIGGNERGAVVEITNSIAELNSYPNLPLKVSRHVALCVNQSIFCIEGEIKGGGKTAKVFHMNLRDPELQWKEVASLQATRSHSGAAVFDGCLVVAGGYKKKGTRTNSVELYESQTNKWRSISPLSSAKSSITLVSCCEGLFAIGGYNGQRVSSVERLSSLNGNWELIAPMPAPRACLVSVFCNGYMYAIGGLIDGGTIADKRVEKYDPDENKWSKAANMNIERYCHSACVLQGKIIVVGGWRIGNQPVREIECYDPVTDAWSIVGRTDYDFTGHAAVLV